MVDRNDAPKLASCFMLLEAWKTAHIDKRRVKSLSGNRTRARLFRLLDKLATDLQAELPDSTLADLSPPVQLEHRTPTARPFLRPMEDEEGMSPAAAWGVASRREVRSPIARLSVRAKLPFSERHRLLSAFSSRGRGIGRLDALDCQGPEGGRERTLSVPCESEKPMFLRALFDSDSDSDSDKEQEEKAADVKPAESPSLQRQQSPVSYGGTDDSALFGWSSNYGKAWGTKMRRCLSLSALDIGSANNAWLRMWEEGELDGNDVAPLPSLVVVRRPPEEPRVALAQAPLRRSKSATTEPTAAHADAPLSPLPSPTLPQRSTTERGKDHDSLSPANSTRALSESSKEQDRLSSLASALPNLLNLEAALAASLDVRQKLQISPEAIEAAISEAEIKEITGGFTVETAMARKRALLKMYNSARRRGREANAVFDTALSAWNAGEKDRHHFAKHGTNGSVWHVPEFPVDALEALTDLASSPHSDDHVLFADAELRWPSVYHIAAQEGSSDGFPPETTSLSMYMESSVERLVDRFPWQIPKRTRKGPPTLDEARKEKAQTQAALYALVLGTPYTLDLKTLESVSHTYATPSGVQAQSDRPKVTRKLLLVYRLHSWALCLHGMKFLQDALRDIHYTLSQSAQGYNALKQSIEAVERELDERGGSEKKSDDEATAAARRAALNHVLDRLKQCEVEFVEFRRHTSALEVWLRQTFFTGLSSVSAVKRSVQIAAGKCFRSTVSKLELASDQAFPSWYSSIFRSDMSGVLALGKDDPLSKDTLRCAWQDVPPQLFTPLVNGLKAFNTKSSRPTGASTTPTATPSLESVLWNETAPQDGINLSSLPLLADHEVKRWVNAHAEKEGGSEAKQKPSSTENDVLVDDLLQHFSIDVVLCLERRAHLLTQRGIFAEERARGRLGPTGFGDLKRSLLPFAVQEVIIRNLKAASIYYREAYLLLCACLRKNEPDVGNGEQDRSVQERALALFARLSMLSKIIDAWLSPGE